MAMQPFKSAITIASLTDDLLAEILLRLPSPASLARAALASKRWRGVASTPDFLSRFRARHTTSPLLGLFVSHANSGLPVFHPAAPVRSDPDLAAAVRGGDFSLTRLEEDPEWCLRDCRNGRLLLSRGNSVNIYDPIFRRRVPVCRPQNDPFPDTYIADCLLHGRGDDGAASFRVVSVQQHGRRMRAGEYDSGTLRWRFHPWMENIKRPQRGHAMHAAGHIFWKCEENSSLLLDTRTMEFSMLRLPVSFFQPSKYAIGEIEDGVCCLVCLNGTMDNLHLQVWLLMEKGGGKTWELEKEMPVSKVLGRHARVRQVRTVATGLVLVCWDERYPQFAIDLKNLSLNSEFMCSGLAYPFQMPWPPAVLVSTEEVQPVQLVHPAEFVPPLQMSTRMVSLDTLVHHVDLAAGRINVVAYTEGPLNLILGPHDPFDTEHVMAAEAENLVATADMEQVMAAEAQSLFAIEKTEEQTSKGPDVPILRRSLRVVERSGGRYENVVRKAMERKASCRDDVELLSALLGRSCSRSENPRGHWILFWDHMSPLTQNKSWLLKKRTCRQLQTQNKSQLLKQTTYWQLKKLRSRLGRGGEERNGGRYENVVRNALESKAHCRDHEELFTRETLEMPDLARGESRVGGISKPPAMEGSNSAAASRGAEAAGGNTPAALSGAVPGVAATTEVQEEMEALVASIPVGAGAAFSAMQLQELEKQSLVYQYMAACIRVPTHLVFPIWRSVTSASSEGTQKYPTLMGLETLCLDFRKNPEPEPGRCRRTDGKKWRCCRHVIPNEKYCERHMHRSRKRPVQLVVEDDEPDSASGSKSASSKATERVKKTDDKSSISKNLAVEAPAAV